MAGSSPLLLYREKRSWLHDRVSPFTKLVVLSTTIVLSFLLPGATLPFCIFISLLVPMAVTAKLFGDLCVLLLKGMVPFLFFLFIVYGFFMPLPDGRVTLAGFISINTEGLLTAWGIGTRVLVMMSALAILFMTTHPSRLLENLAQKGLHPFLCYIVLAALTLIPRLRQRGFSIIDAQRSRGLDTQGNLRARIRALPPLVIPLLYSILADAEMRAAALEVRAFRATGPRSFFILQEKSRAEPIVFMVCVVMIATAAGGRLWFLLN